MMDFSSDFIGYRSIARRSTLGESVTRIETPFVFHDGHPVAIYVSSTGGQTHYYDDGEILFTLSVMGFDLNDRRRLRPLRNIANSFDVSLTDDGQFEVFSIRDRSSLAFARFCAVIVGVINWARDSANLPADESWLVDEVGLYLRAWKPKSELKPDVERLGLSGQHHRFDYELDDQLTDVIVPQQSASAAVLRKIVDVRTATSAQSKFLVVVDDRRRPKEAAQESRILSSVADVWPVSRLMKTVGLPANSQ
jgi:hypothetical protein